MSAILITYDLVNPGQNYKPIHDAIKSYGKWCHVLDSTWVVAGTGLAAASVRDKIRSVTDSNDKLWCVDITGDGWGSVSLADNINDWLKTNA